MNSTKEKLLQQTADLFQANDQPLAAAIAYVEVAREHPSDPEVWLALATALSRCTGQLIRKPLAEWTVRSLKRALAAGPIPERETICHEWLMDLSSEVRVDGLPAMQQEDLPSLLAFLDIDINIFPNAVSALSAEDRGFVVMALGEQGNVRFLPTLLSALRGVWGDFNVRAALKRLGKYGDTPEIRETLEIVAFSDKAQNFQPYLRVALDRIDPEWAYDILQDAAEAREEEEGFPSGGMGTKPWWKFWNR